MQTRSNSSRLEELVYYSNALIAQKALHTLHSVSVSKVALVVLLSNADRQRERESPAAVMC